MNTDNKLKSEEILLLMQIEPDDYPADACFGNLIGTYSKDRQTVCIMAEDNLTETEQKRFLNWSLGKDVIEQIAYSCKKLITNFGCDVHSHTMKTVKPFNNLKIYKPYNLLP
jgi:hypothetical protein